MAGDIRQTIFGFRRPFQWLFLSALALVVALGLIALVTVIGDHPRGVLKLAAALAAVGLVGTVLFAKLGARVPRSTILELDLSSPIAEKASQSLTSRLSPGPKPLVIREVVEVLERAAKDKRVVGLFARVDLPGGGALADELREAVIAFRASGKFAVAYSYSFTSTSGYYVATAFDEIAVQATGDVHVSGWLAQSFFLSGLLEKLGIQPRLGQRHEYKNAVNQLTERSFTPAHREAATRLSESRFEQLVEAVVVARRVTPDVARQTLIGGPYAAPDALSAGLVDQLAYYDEVLDAVKERAGKGSSLLYLAKYAKRTKRGASRGPTIALVHAVGAVSPGKGGGWNPLSQGPTMGADTVAAALRAAAKDKRVKAIVLRIDSPGGVHTASDTIWREVRQAQAKGKPVVASMGNVAASGGYYIAMGADRIVANPGTITGSIGVFGGKYVVQELQKKLGLSTDEVHEGAMATMYSASSDFTPEQWEHIQDSLDLVYDDFTEKAAEGRKMPLDELLQLAKGRVWSGTDALERGLVDQLGGFSTAFGAAREAAGLKRDDRIKVKEFPKKKGAMAQVGSGPDSSESATMPMGSLSADALKALLAPGLSPGVSAALYDVWRLANGAALTMEPVPPMF